MVEHTREHPRRVKAEQPQGTRIELGKGIQLFIPSTSNTSTGKQSTLPLLLHCHGGHWLPQIAAAEAGSLACLSIQVGAGSSVYARLFAEPGSFRKLIASAEKAASRSLTPITLSGWSAGCGALREILRDPRNDTLLENVIALDGIHTSYVHGKPGPLESEIDTEKLASFVRYGREAIAGRQRLFIAHTTIFPGTYASTTETADWLLQELKVPRQAVLEWGPMRTQQLSEARSGSFLLQGFAGNSAPDHVDLLHALPEILATLRQVETTNSDEPPVGLIEVESPKTNPITPAKVRLGKQLFFDKSLSRDGSVACASCHIPDQAFAQRNQATSKGVDGLQGRRNTPSLLNVAYAESLFHDGRAASLEDQAWQPILAEDEMGNRSEQEVIDRLSASDYYVQRFKEAFGIPRPTKLTVAQALASYQRTLLSGNSAFDRWTWGESNALSEAAHKGYKLFAGQALCWQCHPLNSSEAVLLTDHQFHNTGVSFLNAQKHATGTSDLGRFEVTGEAKDRWHFRTPSLRNVALTAPYMHDGSIATLRQVVEFYNRAEGKGELQPLNLNEHDINSLVAFLEALTGE